MQPDLIQMNDRDFIAHILEIRQLTELELELVERLTVLLDFVELDNERSFQLELPLFPRANVRIQQEQ